MGKTNEFIDEYRKGKDNYSSGVVKMGQSGLGSSATKKKL